MIKAIKASQLERDLQLFGKGLNTVIGERGVNISGGPKARISLARAVYSNADIVLLDDPLSAVDPEVANKIFDECVLGALKDKLTILVTHQLQFLEKSEKILLLKNGKVENMGSYEDINATFNIKDILDSYNQSLKKGTDEDKELNVQKKFSAEETSPTKAKE